MNKKIKFFFFGILASLLYFIIFGLISAIIPNPFFIRMIPTTLLDKVFLVIGSILVGTFVYGYFFQKEKNELLFCASTGGILSFLSFACPICNKIIILLIGVSGAMTYFSPLQPIIGVIGVLLLVYANFMIYHKNKKKGGIKK